MAVALVTGGSKGLGRSEALHLAEAGVDVVLTYNSGRGAAEAVVSEIRTMGRKSAALPLDVSRSATFVAFAAGLRKALAELGADRIDYLVNNAGTGIHAAFAETTEAQFEEMVNIHLKSTFFLTQTLLPLIRDGGRILNTSSGLTRFTAPGYAAYAAVKAGIEVLTRYMALELGPRGISVNTIAPGAIETDFGGGAVRDDPAANRWIAGATAMGRAGLPEDIGALVASLLTSDSNWMTAQRIEASGGMSL